MGLATDLGLGNIGLGPGTITNSVSFFASLMTYLFVFGIMIGLGYLIYYILQFKHRFTHVQVVHGRKIMVFDRARTYKDKDGVLFWKTLKTKELAPIPPPEAIELDLKGKKCVRAYRTQEGDFVYSVDTATIEKPPQNLTTIENKIKRKEAIQKWYKEKPLIKSFQPLTSNQRSLFINQIQKAQSRKKISLFERVMPLASTGMFMILIIVMVVSWEDLTAPAASANAAAIELKQLDLQQITALSELKHDVQTIKSSGTVRQAPGDQAS